MFELEDVGLEVLVRVPSAYTEISVDEKIQMIIKAPRGTLTLFDKGFISPDTQCDAIRAFMGEHRYD